MLHWPQGRVAGLHVCKKGMQHSLTVACTCVIDNSCLIAYTCVNVRWESFNSVCVCACLRACVRACVCVIIIIISIFKEDNVFSITASLPYGPPVNTDIDYYRTFFGLVYFCKCCEVSCVIFC